MGLLRIAAEIPAVLILYVYLNIYPKKKRGKKLGEFETVVCLFVCLFVWKSKKVVKVSLQINNACL